MSRASWQLSIRPQEISPYPSAVYSSNFSIRALNQDNQVDASNLIALLERHYGDAPPFPELYSMRYWNDQDSKQSQRIHMIANMEDECVAHVGLEVSRNSNAVRLLLPAIHPDWTQSSSEILSSFWRHIQLLAKRQGWGMVYGYHNTLRNSLQPLASDCFFSEGTAFISSSVGSSSTLCPPRLLMCNPRLTSEDSSSQVFPPLAHAEICEVLYAGLRLDRDIVTPQPVPSSNPDPSKASFRRFSKCDEKTKGICATTISELEMYQLHIIPSALSNLDLARRFIRRVEEHKNNRGQQLVIFVSLEDSLCPKLCEELEEDGFSFCGIAPRWIDCDYAIYGRLDRNELAKASVHTHLSQKLQSYLLQQHQVM